MYRIGPFFLHASPVIFHFFYRIMYLLSCWATRSSSILPALLQLNQPQYVAHLLSPPSTFTNSLATTLLVCSLGCSSSYHS